MNENLEMPKTREFNEEILQSVIDELLAEADRNNQAKLTEGFFWRVLLLYNKKTGGKMPGSEEMKDFYAKIRPMIIKALDEKGRPYESNEKIQGEGTLKSKNKPRPKSKREYPDPQAWVGRTYDQ